MQMDSLQELKEKIDAKNIDKEGIVLWKATDILNKKASQNKYGLVIYPR